MSKPEVDIDTLRRVIRHEGGKLFWLERDEEFFLNKSRQANVLARIWNTQFSGKEAFTANKDGYRSGAIFGKNYRAHRVIFALERGYWPKTIDHKNGIRSDNRIENLIDTSQHQNSKNCRKSKNNTSGFNGVYRDTRTGNWYAKVKHNRVSESLGYFTCIGKAIRARKDKDIELGFSITHGLTAEAAILNLEKLADRQERNVLRGSGDCR